MAADVLLSFSRQAKQGWPPSHLAFLRLQLSQACATLRLLLAPGELLSSLSIVDQWRLILMTEPYGINCELRCSSVPHRSFFERDWAENQDCDANFLSHISSRSGGQAKTLGTPAESQAAHGPGTSPTCQESKIVGHVTGSPARGSRQGALPDGLGSETIEAYLSKR